MMAKFLSVANDITTHYFGFENDNKLTRTSNPLNEMSLFRCIDDVVLIAYRELAQNCESRPDIVQSHFMLLHYYRR